MQTKGERTNINTSQGVRHSAFANMIGGEYQTQPSCPKQMAMFKGLCDAIAAAP